MARTNSDGRTHVLNRTVIATTMSRSPQAGSAKIMLENKSETLKENYLCKCLVIFVQHSRAVCLVLQ